MSQVIGTVIDEYEKIKRRYINGEEPKCKLRKLKKEEIVKAKRNKKKGYWVLRCKKGTKETEYVCRSQKVSVLALYL